MPKQASFGTFTSKRSSNYKLIDVKIAINKFKLPSNFRKGSSLFSRTNPCPAQRSTFFSRRQLACLSDYSTSTDTKIRFAL